MKFIISRTSIWRDEEKPCDEARLESHRSIDCRTTDNPADLEGSWFKYGENHRVENGRAKRDLICNEWLIEVDTLEELIELVLKYGDVIIKMKCKNSDKDFEIEIYDDYRE